MKRDLVAYGHEIKETVMRWTGLPISVGIGYSKTLAKLANHHAKKQPAFRGVCDFNRVSQDELNGVMEDDPVLLVACSHQYLVESQPLTYQGFHYC